MRLVKLMEQLSGRQLIFKLQQELIELFSEHVVSTRVVVVNAFKSDDVLFDEQVCLLVSIDLGFWRQAVLFCHQRGNAKSEHDLLAYAYFGPPDVKRLERSAPHGGVPHVGSALSFWDVNSHDEFFRKLAADYTGDMPDFWQSFKDHFRARSDFFIDFPHLTDEEIVRLFQEMLRGRDVQMQAIRSQYPVTYGALRAEKLWETHYIFDRRHTDASGECIIWVEVEKP